MVKETRNIHRRVLPNGLTVITEQMSHIRSVAIGIWIKAGSRDEDPEWNGISHFIEHMVFKGTENRSAEDIARQVDSIGGNMDAFTAKECVCFNIKVLDEHLPVAMDVLSDLVLHPVFATDDIARERGVILEEIKMDQDNPDYLVHEIFTQSFWKDHPLGKPILGTRETVKKFERPIVSDFYRPSLRARKRCGERRRKSQSPGVCGPGRETLPAREAGQDRLCSRSRPKCFPASTCATRSRWSRCRSASACLRIPIAHEKRYASYVLNTLLGGGMSSRLFQNIRERQGLAYSIYSDLNPYRDTGCMCVYAGTSRESATKVVESVMKEFRDLKSTPVPDEELRRAKDQLKGSLMLSLESSTARMSNLARQEMYFDRFYSLDELIERIEAVTAEDLQQTADQFFRTEQIAVTILGNLNGLKLTRDQLAC